MNTATTIKNRARDRRFRLAAGWWLACALSAAPLAHAGVDITSDVSVGVVKTDNVTLAVTDKQSATVYELIPSVTIAQQSSRVSSNAALRVEGYRYSESGGNEVYQILDGMVRIAPDPDNFFLDLGVGRDQSIRDPTAPVPSSNLPITANRVDRDHVSFGPVFKYPISSGVMVNGSLQRTAVRFADPDLGGFAQDYDEDVTRLSFDNYRKEHGFTWATRYTGDKTDYMRFRPYEYRQAAVELGAWAGRTLRVFASGGKESAWDMPFDPSLADTFWELGVATRADKRIDAEIAAGERSFGSSRRVKLAVDFGRGKLQFDHTEEPTTEERNAFAVAFPTVGLQDLLTDPLNPERYISKLSRLSVSFKLSRANLSAGGFHQLREDRIRFDGTVLPDETQVGTFVVASRRFGAHTELALSVLRESRDLSGSESRDFTTSSVTVSHELSTRTKLSLDYRRDEDEPRTGGTNRYTANVLSLLLTRTFKHAANK